MGSRGIELESVMTRAAQAKAFIAQAGWQDAHVTPLAGDASNRRYDRLIRPDGATAVLMDAPPANNTNVSAFVQIATYLQTLGLSAPRIMHEDFDAGFLLIEDLGDTLFTHQIADSPALEELLYETSMDVLTHLHQGAPPKLGSYASAITVPLAALAFDWYQLGAMGTLDNDAKRDFISVLEPLLARYDTDLTVLIQRDYHAENLLWLPDRTGVARVGLLDFQDAVLGHRSYDLMSVLQDARRDVDPQLATDMKARFVAQNALDPQAFDAAYAVFGLQRNMRILGVFSRLCMRDAKSHYVDFLPRVWGHLMTNLTHPMLEPAAELISATLPEPTRDICATLKSKSGQWAGR